MHHTKQKKRNSLKLVQSRPYMDSASTEKKMQSTWEAFKNHSCRELSHMIDL